MMAHSDVCESGTSRVEDRSKKKSNVVSQVVPIENESTIPWTYEPFSGHLDDEYVWGRGSEDNKSNLIVMMSVVQHLLENGWQPHRTILLCFGFDEEGGADQSQGARCIAQHVEEVYGPNGVELIVCVHSRDCHKHDANVGNRSMKTSRQSSFVMVEKSRFLHCQRKVISTWRYV